MNGKVDFNYLRRVVKTDSLPFEELQLSRKTTLHQVLMIAANTYKQNIKRALKDPDLRQDETRVRFENFSSQVSGVEGSVVYQLAGRGAVTVDPDSSSSVLSETLSHWRELNLSAQFQELEKKLRKFSSLTQVDSHSISDKFSNMICRWCSVRRR